MKKSTLFFAAFLISLLANAQSGFLDLSFDSDGIVTTAIGSNIEQGNSVAIQSDGKILVGGYTWNGSNYDFALVRYNSDGTLDNTFDSDGIVTTPIGSVDDYAQSVVIQTDGKILVTGNSFIGSDNDFALVRYNTNGSLDITFSGDGIVTTPFGSADDYIQSVAIQTDGKIVVAGYSLNGTDYDFALARYNSDGTLDNTFDSDGKVTTDIGSNIEQGNSVAIQSDGKIVVAGYSDVFPNGDFALVRYNSNGSLDNTFDSDGILTTDIGGANDAGYSVAVQNDGKIVIAGVNWNGSTTIIAVARYNNVISKIEEKDISNNDLKVKIYPNPSTGKIQIMRNNNQEIDIEIYNLYGEKIYSLLRTWKSETINLSSQPKGIYFVEVILKNKRESKKIIIE